MKQLLLSLSLLSLASASVPAQGLFSLSEAELLQLAYSPGNPDTLRADALNELAFDFRNDPEKRDSAWHWARSALKIAREGGFRRGQGDAFVRLGLLADKSTLPDSAYYFYEQALAIRQSVGDRQGAATVCNNLGNLLKGQNGKEQQAIAQFQKGLQIMADDANSPSAARIHNNLGALYIRTGQFREASNHLNKALIIRRQQGKAKEIALTLLNKGNLFEALGNSVEAEKAYLESLELFQSQGDAPNIGKCLNALGNHYYHAEQYGQALDYYQQAIALGSRLLPEDRASVLRNQGAIYSETERPEKALETYRYALQQFDGPGLARERAELYYNIGNVFFDQQAFPEAIDNYQQSLRHLDSIHLPGLKSLALYNLSLALDKEGQPEEALRYNHRYVRLRDSLHQNLLDGLNLEIGLAAAEKENAQLKYQLSEQQRSSQFFYGLIGFLLLWLLLLGAVLYAYISRKKRQLATLKLDDVLRNQELERAYAYIEGQDEERGRIAEDLHDRLGSMLSLVKMNFAAIDDKLTALQTENRQKYEKGTALLEQACEEVRHISYNLQSGIITRFGLKAQLETLADDITQTRQLEVELSTHGLKERLDNKLEIQLYRIIQELTNNVIKHARAKKISLQANRFENVVNIMVEDDGQGFDPLQAQQKGGMGLRNVASRIHKLDGTLTIDAARGKGSTIIIDIPIENT